MCVLETVKQFARSLWIEESRNLDERNELKHFSIHQLKNSKFYDLVLFVFWCIAYVLLFYGKLLQINFILKKFDLYLKLKYLLYFIVDSTNWLHPYHF